jgi:hypothetical protein
MLFITAVLGWLSASAFVVAVCRAAAYGDMKLAADGEQPFETRRQSLPAYE